MLWDRWLDSHRWVAEIDGQVVGWAARTATSQQPFFDGAGDVIVEKRAALALYKASGLDSCRAELHRQDQRIVARPPAHGAQEPVYVIRGATA